MSVEAAPLQSAPAPALRARAIRAAYQRTGRPPLPVLDGIDLTVTAGEVVALLGPSGCGKSTLLRILAGLQLPSDGTVEIDGRPPAVARQAKALGLMLQEHALLPWRTALDNVRLGLEVNQQPGSSATLAREALSLVGLTDFADYYPHQLSGGMRQRVALARTLALRPRLLLLDEPFAALDELTREELGWELAHLRTLTGATAVLVTHSVAEAVTLADRVVVLGSRPARVLAVVAVELPRPRTTDVEATAEFARQVGEIKWLLRGGVATAQPRATSGSLQRRQRVPS